MALRADELWTICGRSVPVQVLSEQFEDVPCRGGIRPLGLGLAVLFLGLPVVPQFQKTIGEPVLLEFAGTTAVKEKQLVSVELPVPVRETSQRRRLFECNSRRFSFLKSYIFAECSFLLQVPV